MSNPTVAQVLAAVEYDLQAIIGSGGALSDIRRCYLTIAPESLVLSTTGYPCLGVCFAGAEKTGTYAGEGLYRWSCRVTVWVMALERDLQNRQAVLKAAAWEYEVRNVLEGTHTLPGMDEIRFVSTGEPRPFVTGGDQQILVIGIPIMFECYLHNDLDA